MRRAELAGRQLTLTFKGINYAAEVWVNGEPARQHPRRLHPRRVRCHRARCSPASATSIAVRVSPPPHPGIPHEESIAAGPGENGGWVALDGPTFAASEGWDWIPGIRDRNTGIWQDVELRATGRVRLLDPQVDHAAAAAAEPTAPTSSITVPVESSHAAPVDVTVDRAVRRRDAAARRRPVAPGESEVRFTPAEFPQLNVTQSAPVVAERLRRAASSTTSTLAVSERGTAFRHEARCASASATSPTSSRCSTATAACAASKSTSPAAARAASGSSTSATRRSRRPRTAGPHRSRKAGETSPAVRELDDSLDYPHLTLRVNGVRILARGGNWGMDDSRKRIQRERLEPYFRLQQAANLNIIRNWMGTNTEDVVLRPRATNTA